MSDDIGRDERGRLGYDPIEKEGEFIKLISPYNGCMLDHSNQDKGKKYDIDISVFDKNWNIIGWIDLETRTNTLSTFSSIHVPVYSFKDYWYEINKKISPKVIHYQKYPKRSFHVSWSIYENRFFLIRGYDVINSPQIETYDRKRNRKIFVFDVPKSNYIEVNKDNLIKVFLLELNKKERIQLTL